MQALQVTKRFLAQSISRGRICVTSQVRYAQEGFDRLNIYKDPAKAPQEMEDHKYPDWLWCLHDPEPTKEELLREATKLYDEGGYDRVFECMDENRMKRLFRLQNRDRIKMNNARRKGGQVV